MLFLFLSFNSLLFYCIELSLITSSLINHRRNSHLKSKERMHRIISRNHLLSFSHMWFGVVISCDFGVGLVRLVELYIYFFTFLLGFRLAPTCKGSGDGSLWCKPSISWWIAWNERAKKTWLMKPTTKRVFFPSSALNRPSGIMDSQ